MRFFQTLLALLFMLCVAAELSAEIKLEQLMVNYQEQPLGTDQEVPRFSWLMTTDKQKRGLEQKAYQIVVRNEVGKQVWDSGKVASSSSVQIDYTGEALQARTRYSWDLSVWDQENNVHAAQSWFETGLMNSDPALSAWGGAEWIGGADTDMNFQSHSLTVFKFQYQIQLDEASSSTRAAFVIGANDARLMHQHLNLYGTVAAQDESYISLELDISAVGRAEGLAKLNIYRVGYAPDDDPRQPLTSLDIPAKLINPANKYDAHQIYVEMLFGVMEVYVNGQGASNLITPMPSPGSFGGPRGVNLNPYRGNGSNGGDFICFPLLGDIGFAAKPGQKAHFSEVQVRNYRRPSNIVFQDQVQGEPRLVGKGVRLSDTGYQIDGGEGGILTVANPSRNATPMLRTEFRLANKSIRKARLYVTARGIYEMHLNGTRVGNDYFNPGLTQYNKTHHYQTYDVTDLLKNSSNNALGAWMSEGWWSGNITFNGANWNFFGDRQSLLCQLLVTYTDGSEQVVVSRPDQWKVFTQGPIVYGSFFQGEYYDATRETDIEGWSEAGFNDETWTPAVSVPLNGTTAQGSFVGFGGRTTEITYDQMEIVGQIGDNAKVVTTIIAKSVEEVRPGVFVYDMGQNMVGVPEIEVSKLDAGQVLRMRYAEVKYPDLPDYKGQEGMIMMENIRAALTTDTYVAKGGAETIRPRFTFHGFRFLEISGMAQALPLDQVRGLVISSVSKLDAKYETANPLVNKLWENITWSLRGNFLSIPTDTPARNERMGWNGDINVFGRTATYLTQADLFLNRHLRAIRDMQRADGRFSDVAPIGNGFGGVLWGSAGVRLAWELYQQYGDRTILAEHYTAMKAYMSFLSEQLDEAGFLKEGPLGDWLSPENAKNDNTLLWAAYHAHCLEIMSKMAEALGKSTDAADYATEYENRKQFLNQTYVDAATGKTVYSGVKVRSFGGESGGPKGKPLDTQASYAIPLAFDLFKEDYKEAAIQHFVETITRENVDDSGAKRPPYSLMTGFIGTASIATALSENGEDEVAYRLLQQETYPSWLYPVMNGASTIWERLNSYTHEAGFGGNNSMNSFNHYAFGAVAVWMSEYSLGIQRDPNNPGFKHFVLRPTPDPTRKMAWAKGHYDSVYGRIVSEWEQKGNRTIYRIVVPPNTTAELRLPAERLAKVREGKKSVQKAQGVQYLSQEGERLHFSLQSGTYQFTVRQ